MTKYPSERSALLFFCKWSGIPCSWMLTSWGFLNACNKLRYDLKDPDAMGRRKIRIACQNQMRLIRVESGCWQLRELILKLDNRSETRKGLVTANTRRTQSPIKDLKELFRVKIHIPWNSVRVCETRARRVHINVFSGTIYFLGIYAGDWTRDARCYREWGY